METFEKIIEQYTQSEVCMGELLANISADGMSIEDAFELYIKDTQPLKQLLDSLSIS